MPLRPFRRQYEQLSQFQWGRIIGMVEAGWTARRVVRQLGRSDCVVRKCWNQGIREISFIRRPGSGSPRQTSRREDRHIRPLCLLKPYEGAWLKDIWDRGAHYVGLSLTPAHRRLRLEWCRARGNWTAVEWNQVVFSDESRFNLSTDDNRVRVWRSRDERLNSAFALQRHTAPTAVVMVWGAIFYYTRSPLVLIRGTMTTQRYVHDILQPHVLPLIQRLRGAFFNKTMLGFTRQGCHKTVSALLLSFLGLPYPHICLQLSISGIIWDGELGIPRI
ncbi:transposable element Tcb2 transposase [Trichonephila clavipes]|nr:transposable element Tcb2 transposase [Trichonephila clavipes]